MKAAIFVLLAVAGLLVVECANHNRKHKAEHEDIPGDGGNDQWPSPQTVSDFGVPPMFSGGSGNPTSGADNGGEASSSSPSSSKQHARANQKHHNHQ